MRAVRLRPRTLFGSSLILAVLLGACSRRNEPRGPVIIYLVDTLRYDRMSAYGNPRPTSPAAERLASEGVRYDAAYSVASWTRPSVASLLTSRWPSEAGAVGRSGVLSPNVRSMAEVFHANGWATAAFCGQPNVYIGMLGFHRGFDTFDAREPLRGAADAGVTTANRVVNPAIRWIDKRSDPRFFLYVHVVDPHNNGWSDREPNPYRHWLPGYENLFSRGRPMALDSRDWRLSKYDALIRQADDQFARLRAALEKKGFWKNALVTYVADHGEEFYEHGRLFHGHSLFEELVHIPLIVKAPDWGRPGQIEKAPVSLLDLLPSIASWASLPRDPSWRGRTIDRERPNPGGTVYFSEELDHQRLYGMRRGSREMIASLNPPYRVEFDVARDPGEQSPVPNEPEMTRVLEKYRQAEIASYGGLRIRKVESVPATIAGFVQLPEQTLPYLALPDRQRFPIDPRRPDELPISAEIGADARFEVHLESLEGQSPIAPCLTVFAGEQRREVQGAFAGRAGPLEITEGRSELSPSKVTEVIQRMRALGYLGGNRGQ